MVLCVVEPRLDKLIDVRAITCKEVVLGQVSLEELSQHMIEAIIHDLHERYVLCGLKSRAVHGVTYVLFIDVVN